MSGWGVVALGYVVAAVAWLLLVLRVRRVGRR
jgi:uncharacterized membrane protein